MVTTPQTPPLRPVSLAEADRHLSAMRFIRDNPENSAKQRRQAADLAARFEGWVTAERPSRPTR